MLTKVLQYRLLLRSVLQLSQRSPEAQNFTAGDFRLQKCNKG